MVSKWRVCFTADLALVIHRPLPRLRGDFANFGLQVVVDLGHGHMKLTGKHGADSGYK